MWQRSWKSWVSRAALAAALALPFATAQGSGCVKTQYKLPQGKVVAPLAAGVDVTGSCSTKGELKLNDQTGLLMYCDSTWKVLEDTSARLAHIEARVADLKNPSSQPDAVVMSGTSEPSGACTSGALFLDTASGAFYVCAAGGWVNVQGKNPACLGAATLLTAGLPASAATASSIYGGESPGNAIDGITTIHNQFHSNNEANSWWRVDLGVEATVDYIDFVNNFFNCGGSTGCGFRSVGAVIYVSSTTSAPWSGGSGVQCGAPYASSDLASDATPHRFDCPDDTVGRYVWWYRASTEYTNFVELSPYGWPAADC